MVTDEQLYVIFLKSVADAGGRTQWGEKHGYKRQYVRELCERTRGISENVAAKLGYRPKERVWVQDDVQT
jgi:hypothetical protein